MVRKIAFGCLWLGFVIYAFFLAPPEQPGTFDLIKNLSTGQWQGINPLVIALFNLMGIWPLIYSAVVFIDGRGQKIPAWLFATTSFAVGIFALLPYLVLREPNNQFVGKKNILLKLLDSRVTGVVLTVATVLLVAYGLIGGDWGSFVQEWQTNRFINVMSLDFSLLCLLFPALLGDDMARRSWKNPHFWFIAFIPLFGPLIYLSVRPPLQEVGIESISKQPEVN
ncbi:MAG: DUF2834 domain-containing protein [Nostoc sp. NMS1]|uniref:DUF2834 domain-containing protein n=1 Tax=unclassified Nostoc TaxID=2593658 RepID=UPI0025CE5F95|nr:MULTISPECIES: DUF2834 domain-containing protein [unclassified Nostoc]MBN3905078.1 DUF2834 domain-containing protein [Nostoc sp. NMS1]MBN3994000.1 DUF2834 domain-containing protein [Nostoc sp. NMS2]